MSGEPPEGVVPAPAPPVVALASDGEAARRAVPRPAAPASRSNAPAVADGDGMAPSERRPSAPERAPDGPPEIQRLFASAGPTSERSSSAPPSSSPDGGVTRRRSRRTVKIPNDAVPQSEVAPEATPEPAPVAAAAPPPAPARAAPAIPRPVPKAPPAVPAQSAPPPPDQAAPAPVLQAAAAPTSEDSGEVIRPMRIISIGTMAPSSPPPPIVVDDAGWETASEQRTSRPPLLASPELAAFNAPPPPAVPKPPAVEEIEAIEEEEEQVAAPRGARTDEIEPIPLDEVEEPHADAAPRGARTDEIEPIHVDEVEERISDFDIAPPGDLSSVEVPVDLDEPRPKKPPPPPPKRPNSVELPPSSSASPSAARAADATPPPGPDGASVSKPPGPVATPPPPAPLAAPAAPPAAAAPAAAPTTDLTGKKRQKSWWEEVFSDDYIRTMERVEPKAIHKECDFIEDRLGLEKGAIMLDLACGAGTHAVELASRGYNVVGYDLSLAMLARAQDEAQERGQKINFLQGDMREMAFEEAFDGMYSWSTSFGYFDDEKNLNVLSRIHRGLRQGGMFLLDVINRDYVCPRQPSLVWFEGDGCVCMDEMFVDFFTSRLRVKRTVMFEDGRSRECDYSIRLYGLHELGRMLHETGFKVVEVTGHPAHPGVFFGSESPRVIVLAERG
jgi:SAM-dependent methyltransferase